MIKLKLGFIGGSINSAVGYAHFAALNIDNKFELVSGFFSRSKKISIETAKNYNIDTKRAYHSIDSFLEKESSVIDAVVILSPTNIHHDHVIKCLNYKLNVICEKALTTSSKKAKEIESLSEKNKLKVITTFNYTGYPMVRELKSICNSNDYGFLKKVILEMPQQTFLKQLAGKPIIPQNWRLYDYEIPTISLDLGVHLVSILHFFINQKPKKILGFHNTFGNFSNVIDDVNSLISFENGVESSLWFSKSAIGFTNGLNFKLFFEKASFFWDQSNPELLIKNLSNGDKFFLDRSNPEIKEASKKKYERFKTGHPAGFIEAFANYYTDIHNQLVFNENKNLISLSKSIEGLEILEMIHKSADTNSKWLNFK